MGNKPLSAVIVVALLGTGCAISSTIVRVRDVNRVSLGYPTPTGPREVLRPNSPGSPPVIIPGSTGFYTAVWPDYRLRFCCGVAGAPQIRPDGAIELAGLPLDILNTPAPLPGQPLVMNFRLQQLVRAGRGYAVYDSGDAWLRTPEDNVREIAEHRSPNIGAGAGLLAGGLPLALVGAIFTAVSVPPSGPGGLGPTTYSPLLSAGIAMLVVGVPLAVAGIAVMAQPNEELSIWRAP